MRTTEQILKRTKYKETQLEVFLTECYIDFSYFAEHVLGFEVAEYHNEWFSLMEKYPRLCMLAFRGSGKTNFVAGYFLWKAIFSEGLNFLILSKNFEQSKIVLKIIRTMVVDNELLKQFVPDDRNYSWKATELTLKTGSVFYCRTYGEGVRGLRIDYLLCDEAGDYEDKTIFWTAVSPVVQLNRGKIFVIGTTKSSVDLLQELKENDEYIAKEYPAEIDGKALWEKKYTTLPYDTATQRSLVKIKKEIGELNYMQEFLLIPISSANSLFPYELTMNSLMDDEKFLPFGRKDEKYYIGYDIAISLKGDYTVMIVLGVNADRKRIVKAVRFRGSFQEQRIRLKKLIDDFKPLKVCIDATGLGEQQAKDLSDEFPNVKPVKITYDEKYKMLLDLRQEFERYNLMIPNSKEDMDTYSFSQTLISELNDFALRIDLRQGKSTRPQFHSGKYDDCVMSLALANLASQNAYGQVSIAGLEF